MSTAKSRLPAMDLLRFAAAMGVLAYHYISSYLPDDPGAPWLAATAHVTRYGYLGVELFFIISGFVILWSAQGKTATAFAVSRVCRLYPTFWAAVLLTSACYLLLGPYAPGMAAQEISPYRLLANATMMPQLFDAERIDGVYWTLELEIRFYFLIFALLLLRQIGNIERWLYLWLAACAWITLQGAPRWIEFFAVAPYGSFFIGGCLLYLLHSGGWTWQRAAGLAVAVALSVVDSLRIRSGFITADAESEWVVPMLVILLFGVLLILLVFLHRPEKLSQSTLSYRLGALTYPLYLTHAAIGRMLMEILLPHVGAVMAVILVGTFAIVIAQILVVLVDEPARKPMARLCYQSLDFAGCGAGQHETRAQELLMAYSASQASAAEARSTIETLWEQVYGGFSSIRYEWLYLNNPAGTATVCLLRDEDSGAVVGSTALLPRTLCSHGNVLRGGIAADLMVDHRHRSLGPAIVLQKGILGRLAESGIDLVYAFPNPKSIPMTRRIGYRQVAQRMALVLPLRSEAFLRDRISHTGIRKAAATLIDIALYLRPRLYKPVPQSGQEHFIATSFDPQFDELWSRIKSGYALIGEKIVRFLNWRYRDSPLGNYAVFGLCSPGRQVINGYVVHSRQDKRMNIADFAWDPTRTSLEELLIRFAQWSRTNGAEAISIALTASPDLIRRFCRAGFHLREAIDPLTVFTTDSQPISIEADPGQGCWYLVPGDNDA